MMEDQAALLNDPELKRRVTDLVNTICDIEPVSHAAKILRVLPPEEQALFLVQNFPIAKHQEQKWDEEEKHGAAAKISKAPPLILSEKAAQQVYEIKSQMRRRTFFRAGVYALGGLMAGASTIHQAVRGNQIGANEEEISKDIRKAGLYILGSQFLYAGFAEDMIAGAEETLRRYVTSLKKIDGAEEMKGIASAYVEGLNEAIHKISRSKLENILAPSVDQGAVR